MVSEKIHGMGQNKTWWFGLKPMFLRISGDDAKNVAKKKKKSEYDVQPCRSPKPTEDVSNYPSNIIHILVNDEAR